MKLKGIQSLEKTFFRRALENIYSAEILYDNNLFNASANRAYYAAFHIAISAIYHSGIVPKIDHRSVQANFSDCFINRKKVLSSKYKRYLNDLQDRRNNADYKMGVTKKMAKI